MFGSKKREEEHEEEVAEVSRREAELAEDATETDDSFSDTNEALEAEEEPNP
ncbi:hypothetical protein [Arthrobacter woluwensis]|uniref:Uncharacterized protein n=1 Tax=Arthrobacter woluwensis TaxID=156980 RepID=A0A1H4JJJ1_9MICC|nr:hypothetical protein [Arthrobacter woluwensis]SEB46413.1 hypothetical protein SAMN04489745_0220 [Arthrobacter woluwensis]